MSATNTRVQCPVEGCESTLSRRNNISAHLQRVHGLTVGSSEYQQLMQDRRPSPPKTGGYFAVVDGRIKELTKPLREELRGIEKRLTEIEGEANDLRAARKRIEKVLRDLDPTSFVAKPKKNGNGLHPGDPELAEQKKKAVLDFIQGHATEYADGFTAAGVWRDMKAAEVEPITSAGKVKDMIEDWHANGVIRADRKIRGGAMQYKLIGASSNGA